MISFILAATCGVTLLLAIVVIVIIVISNDGHGDVVSSARQGWINRRSDEDQDGW